MNIRYLVFPALSLLLLASCHGTKKVTSTDTSSGRGNETASVAPEMLGQQALFIDATKEKILGNYKNALSKYAECLRVNPKNGAAAYEMAAIFMASGQVEQAMYYSKQAADLDPKNSWYQLQYGRILQKANKPKDAVDVFERLTKNFPDRSDFVSELSYAQFFAKDYEGSLKSLEKAETMEGGPSIPSLDQKLKITQKAYPQKPEMHMTIIRKMIELEPKEPRYYGMLGDYYQKTGEPEKALETYKQLLEVDPGNGYAHISISEYYFRQGKKAEAFSELKTAFANPDVDVDTKVRILVNNYYYPSDKSEPGKDSLKPQYDVLLGLLTTHHAGDAKAWAMTGDFRARDLDYKQARESYRKSVDIDKEHYAIWGQLINMDIQISNVDLQISDSKEAAELFPTQVTPYLIWGSGLVQKKQYSEALEPLRTGSAYVVENPKVLAQFYIGLGDAYNGLKQYADADRAFDKAIATDPKNFTAYNNYAYYLSLRGEKLDAAEQMILKATEGEPENVAYMDTYAWLLYKTGRYSLALNWIEKALSKPSDDGSMYEHYGDILFRLDRKDEALKQWKIASGKTGTSDKLSKKISDQKLYE